MQIPKNAIVYETPISTHWITDDLVMCTSSKKVERTIEHYQIVFELYANLTADGKKLCLISDMSNAMPMSDEIRKFVTSEIPKFIKANALISDSPLHASLTNAFIKLSFNGFPVKQFNNESDAREWIKNYL